MSAVRNGSLRSRHIGELVEAFSRDLSRLLKLEVELAKAEIRELVEGLRAEAQGTFAEARGELEIGGRRIGAALSENSKEAGVASGLFAGAAIFVLGAFGALTAFLILVLAEAMPAWGAALVVIALWAAVASLLAFLGRQRWRRAVPVVPTTEIRRTAANVSQVLAQGKERFAEAMPPVPEQTIETVKEDIEWAKHPTRSGAR